jgi:hypothetical protein
VLPEERRSVVVAEQWRLQVEIGTEYQARTGAVLDGWITGAAGDPVLMSLLLARTRDQISRIRACSSFTCLSFVCERDV